MFCSMLKCTAQVIVCSLSAGMAFYSQLFWITMFMQDMQGLTPLAVAARLLPQALVGLVVSPLVGFIMHKVPGTVLLVIAGISLFMSNILLVFVHHDSNYFSWIFPSLMLSTVGMDWIINVGSVSSFFISSKHVLVVDVFEVGQKGARLTIHSAPCLV